MKVALRHIAPLVALLALSAWVGGCAPDITCEDVGCPFGESCNAATGLCESPSRDCVESGCPTGQVCDESSGACRSAGVQCGGDSSCPSGWVCDTQTGYCKSRSSCVDDPCTSPAKVCNEASGACEPRTCVADADCPVAYVCADSRQCVAGCRAGSERCAPGEFCLAPDDDAIGQCTETCDTDLDCPTGQECRRRTGATDPSCQPRACADDFDCRTGSVCRNSVCGPPPCTADADCRDGAVCDLATGDCIGADCAEDLFAPNQSADAAAALRLGGYAELTVCPGRSDWFSVDVDASEYIEVRLSHAPQVDLDVYLWGPNDELLTLNEQPSATTTTALLSTRRQTVRLEVRPTGTAESRYDLSLSVDPGQFCSDDRAEQNDSPDEASMLPTTPGVPTRLDLTACGPDADWFALADLSADQGLRLDPASNQAVVLTTLLTPDGQRFRVRQGSTLDIVRLGTAGDYLIEARAPYGAAADYALTTQVRLPYDCPQAGEHATADTALPLAAETLHTLELCPKADAWEVEWLELDPPAAPGSLDVRVLAVGDLPPLDVVLFTHDAQGGLVPLRRAVRLDGRYEAHASVAAGQPLLVRLSAEAAPGRVVGSANYQLSYAFEGE